MRWRDGDGGPPDLNKSQARLRTLKTVASTLQGHREVFGPFQRGMKGNHVGNHACSEGTHHIIVCHRAHYVCS